MEKFDRLRKIMLENHLKARGITDGAVLKAMEEIPREQFLPETMAEFAYEDSPLPIGEGQTISQPYIVAVMTQLLELKRDDRVLEIGTGSGYAAAILSRIVDEVYTIERHKSLADEARKKFQRLGYDNIHVHHGDGTLGWPEHAPYDAIVVTAGAPEPPESLKKQLAIGGRLVIPTGSTRVQELVRIRRIGDDEYEREEHFSVRFVPLVGAEGWPNKGAAGSKSAKMHASRSIHELIARAADTIPSIDEKDISPLLDRIGDARVVLLGEATHGTAEFYEMRARITRELVEKKGFNIVAIEADWPDVSQIDRYIRGLEADTSVEKPFKRFPAWMWANTQFSDFVESLREINASQRVSGGVSLYGLDLYSLYKSIEAVLKYLDDIDPETAAIARQRYGCLTPWQKDPAAYGAATLTGRYEECEAEVVKMLQDLLDKRLAYEFRNEKRFLNAVQNARVVSNAEQYYRVMYYGSRESWNLRDRHMFDTLNILLGYHGAEARAVVWEHNSHIGNAAATEMGISGEKNVGLFCREAFDQDAYLVGFGTDHGTVGAASEWNKPMEIMHVQPSHRDSYEYLCHQTEINNFFLPLRNASAKLRETLAEPRLQRAIGVVYLPETELQSHYFYADLTRQFDEYIWFDESRAVRPLTRETGKGLPETFPFGV
ncbi:MAG: protein-L-isoaspartate(D-aspartate) O-methyltransferase [Desulfobacterales bacterium]